MNTTSLCNTCYAEIPAYAAPFSADVVPTLYKVCPEHGIQKATLEGDWEFYEQYCTYDRIDHYKVLIINVTDTCNIKCKHCYFPVHNSWHMPLETFKDIVTHFKDHFTTFTLSGGDPTCWPHYFEAAEWCREQGVYLSQLTNGVRFTEPNFWANLEQSGFIVNNCVMAEMSIHPATITSEEVRHRQIAVLQQLRDKNMKLSCIMMNVATNQHSAIELDDAMLEMVAFMQEWRDVTCDFRTRPICYEAWNNPAVGAKYRLSDLVKSLTRIAHMQNLEMVYSHRKDIDNIYNQNFIFDGISLVTVCAANLENIDLGYLDRGPYMLANDGVPYSVPHAIIINEGIDKGWYCGKRITSEA